MIYRLKWKFAEIICGAGFGEFSQIFAF